LPRYCLRVSRWIRSHLALAPHVPKARPEFAKPPTSLASAAYINIDGCNEGDKPLMQICGESNFYN
jgi:hypothetical protein